MADRPEVVDAAENRVPRNGTRLLRPVARALRNAATRPVAADVDGVGHRIFTAGIALAAIGLVVQSLLHLAEIVVFDRGVNTLDLDEDYGIGSWASVVATFTAGAAAALLAVICRDRVFVALAALLAFLSFDDYIRLHERVGQAGELFGLDPDLELGRVIWPALLFPLLAVGGALLWIASNQFGGSIPRLLRAGLVLLGVAVVLEAASAALFQFDYGHRSWPYEIEVLVEEGAELVGWTWIATALLAGACSTLVDAARRR